MVEGVLGLESLSCETVLHVTRSKEWEQGVHRIPWEVTRKMPQEQFRNYVTGTFSFKFHENYIQKALTDGTPPAVVHVALGVMETPGSKIVSYSTCALSVSFSALMDKLLTCIIGGREPVTTNEGVRITKNGTSCSVSACKSHSVCQRHSRFGLETSLGNGSSLSFEIR